MKEEIIKELKKLEPDVNICRNVVKNNAHLTGVSIGKEVGVMRPMVYIEDFDGETAEGIANEILKVLREHELKSEIDVSALTTKSNILENARLILAPEKSAAEELVKFETPLQGIVAIPVVEVNNINGGSGFFRVQEGMLEDEDISREELYDASMKHTEAQFEFKRDFMGLPMKIVTNKSLSYGAVSVLCKDKMAAIVDEEFGGEALIIPSSVTEAILIDTSIISGNPTEYLKVMIGEVNDSEVDPRDQLGDQAYVITSDGEEVEYFTAEEYFNGKDFDER